MKKRRLSALFLSLTMAATLLAGCGGSSGEQQTQAAGEVAAPTGEAAETVYITGSFPLNIDPAVASSDIDASVMFNVYDSLVFIEDDGTLSNHIADSYEVSEDGLTYTFKLKTGITFHDGSEITASDVAFSMNRMLAIGQGFSYLFTPYVESAEAVDDTTVVFHMKKTFGPFVNALIRLSILNEELVMANAQEEGDYGEFGDYGMNWLLTNDAGSGPYMVESVSVESNLTAVKFDDYYLGWEENAPSRIEFMAVNDAATIQTLMSRGELDITDVWQSQDNLKALDALEGIDVTNMYTGMVINLEMNTAKAPTDDIHFRKALAYLFDYDTVTSQIFPGAKQAIGPVSGSYEGSNQEMEVYSYNIEKAKEELAQSPYADQLDQYPITIEWSADVTDEEKLCLLLQQACAQVGITLNIQQCTFSTLIDHAATPEGTAHLTVMYPSDSYGEAGSVLSLRYHTTTSGTFTQYEWLLDEEIDAAIEASLETLDKESRLEQYRAIQEDLVEMCPTIWACEYPEMRAYNAAKITWPAAEFAKEGGNNAPIMGRSIYCRTMTLNK